MCQLIESIQVVSGKAFRLPYHEQRMNRSRKALFHTIEPIRLSDLEVPLSYRTGKYKCRIVYRQDIERISFVPYHSQSFDRFVIEEADFDYQYKFLNREAIHYYKQQYPKTTEVIFTRKGRICDSSFSNLIFKNKNTGQWETPASYLLGGTQRQYLLDQKMITEKEIQVTDLKNYSHFMLINALLEFDEQRIYPINLISF